MSAKPRFKPRVGWADEFLGGKWWNASPMDFKRYGKSVRQKVRVVDARDLTPEQAIADTITRNVYLDGDGPLDATHLPQGYSARVVNGKVRVRRLNR